LPTSAEVRWFFDGPIPPDVEEWFCRGGLFSKAAPRVDHYIRVPASLGLNIKLREGRLEIKALTRTVGLRTFAAYAAGNVQIWEKRVTEDAAAGEFERLQASSPHLWLAVRKERALRKYALEHGSPTEVQAGAVFLSEGCNAELTKLIVDGADYWSVALEAYGDPARVEDALVKAAAQVLSDPHRLLPSTGAALPAANSRSYPEWLERFLRP
jgi:hypothetical protein